MSKCVPVRFYKPAVCRPCAATGHMLCDALLLCCGLAGVPKSMEGIYLHGASLRPRALVEAGDAIQTAPEPNIAAALLSSL